MRDVEGLATPISVWVYVNAFGEHEIPLDVRAKATRLSGGRSIYDKRTRGYAVLKAWMEKADAESARAFMAGE